MTKIREFLVQVCYTRPYESSTYKVYAETEEGARQIGKLKFLDAIVGAAECTLTSVNVQEGTFIGRDFHKEIK